MISCIDVFALSYATGRKAGALFRWTTAEENKASRLIYCGCSDLSSTWNFLSPRSRNSVTTDQDS
jgi:hypothetical protein